MTWPEKKKNRIFVQYLTDNAVDHSAIRHSGRSDMSARNKDKNPSPGNQSYNFKDKQPKLWR